MLGTQSILWMNFVYDLVTLMLTLILGQIVQFSTCCHNVGDNKVILQCWILCHNLLF